MPTSSASYGRIERHGVAASTPASPWSDGYAKPWSPPRPSWGWLLPLVNYSFARDPGPWLGGAVLALLIVIMAPWVKSLVPADTPPIVLKSLRVYWVGPRTFESATDGIVRTRSCPLVVTSRGVLLDDGGYVGVTATIMNGPRRGEQLTPRRDVENIEPGEQAPLILRYEIPEWIKDVDLDRISLFNLTQRTPDDRPCADGYSGKFENNVTIGRNSEWRRSNGYPVTLSAIE